MGWMRAGVLWSLLVAMACGGKAGGHGAAGGEAGTGGNAVKDPPANNGGTGTPPGPEAGGAASIEPDETGGIGSGGDSASAGEGGGPAEPVVTFCDENPHQFCADFDGSVFDEGWDGQDAQGSGSLAPFTDDSTSPPRALLSKVEKDYSVASATMNVTFPPGAQHYLLTFDLFIDATSVLPNAQHSELSLFQVVNGDSSTGLSLGFDQQGDRLWYATNNSNSGYIWSGFLPLQQWFHVELSVTYGTLGTGIFDLKLGDAEPIHWMDSSVSVAPGSIQLRLGLQTPSASYDLSAMYDNVTLDLTP